MRHFKEDYSVSFNNTPIPETGLYMFTHLRPEWLEHYVYIIVTFLDHGNSQSCESLTPIKPQNAPRFPTWFPPSSTPAIPHIHPGQFYKKKSSADHISKMSPAVLRG